jgi:hypothetical protein
MVVVTVSSSDGIQGMPEPNSSEVLSPLKKRFIPFKKVIEGKSARSFFTVPAAARGETSAFGIFFVIPNSCHIFQPFQRTKSNRQLKN